MMCPAETIDEILERWISGHLYYHQSLDKAVLGFVHPLVVSLVRKRQISSFFFVRYGLGGPHIRLRLQVSPGARERVIEAVQQSARSFLETTPSTCSVGEEEIRRINESILAFDPNEDDRSVYPDNSFWMVPFRPEIERYGGLNRLQASLDFFSISSVAAIDFLLKYCEMPRSAQLAHAFRLLLHLALGFAADRAELSDLLRYGVDSWGGGPARIIEKAERVFQSQIDTFLQLFHQSLAEAGALQGATGFIGEMELLTLGASRLSAAVKATDRPTRARIGGSQLHMTASRLGISNVEEVYISRLLTLTLNEVLATTGESFSWLAEKMAAGAAEDPDETITPLLPRALAAFSRSPAYNS